MLITEQSPLEFLSSWNEGTAKQQIVNFVDKVTDPLSHFFVPPKKRIAVFDNDATLCPQKPLFFQTAFLQARVAQMVKEKPELLNCLAYRVFAEKNPNYRQVIPWSELQDFFLSSQSGMTQKEYKNLVKNFLKEETHPDFKKPYTDLAYQPMLELIEYLKAKNFRVYLNTAGGADFVRVLAKKVYKIQPNKVIGTPIKLQISDKKEFNRLNEFAWPLNNAENKMVHIEHIIGRPPILAVGDSDGDEHMLAYAKAQKIGLAILLKHDDSEREYQYDDCAKSALKKAEEQSWLIVSMKNDFKNIFKFQKTNLT